MSRDVQKLVQLHGEVGKALATGKTQAMAKAMKKYMSFMENDVNTMGFYEYPQETLMSPPAEVAGDCTIHLRILQGIFINLIGDYATGTNEFSKQVSTWDQRIIDSTAWAVQANNIGYLANARAIEAGWAVAKSGFNNWHPTLKQSLVRALIFCIIKAKTTMQLFANANETAMLGLVLDSEMLGLTMPRFI